MKAEVVAYTEYEGGGWKEWPWPSCVKPTNPQLLAFRHGPTAVLKLVGHPTGAIIFMLVHALKLSNGREWDSINGFRDGGGPA